MWLCKDKLNRKTANFCLPHVPQKLRLLHEQRWYYVNYAAYVWFIYRLTHSTSELSRFTCTSSLTMNEKFQYLTRPPSAVLKNFVFIVSERVQVNPDNSRAMSALLTFLSFKLKTLQAKIVKF